MFSTPEAQDALDHTIVDSLGRRGLWHAVSSMEEVRNSGAAGKPTGDADFGIGDRLIVRRQQARCERGAPLYHPGSARRRRHVSARVCLLQLTHCGDLSLIRSYSWCDNHAAYLATPPHTSSLPYQLHRSVFLRLSSPAEALAYARKHLMPFLPTQPVTQLITSCLYPSTAPSTGENQSPYMEETSDKYDFRPLVVLFRTEYCRRHGLPKEEPLEVVVDLGGRGGALHVIEKARRVMGDRLGNIRTWDELPVCR